MEYLQHDFAYKHYILLSSCGTKAHLCVPVSSLILLCLKFGSGLPNLSQESLTSFCLICSTCQLLDILCCILLLNRDNALIPCRLYLFKGSKGLGIPGTFGCNPTHSKELHYLNSVRKVEYNTSTSSVQVFFLEGNICHWKWICFANKFPICACGLPYWLYASPVCFQCLL